MNISGFQQGRTLLLKWNQWHEMIDIKLACEEAIERKDKETCNAVRWAAAGWLTSIALFAILVAVFVFK